MILFSLIFFVMIIAVGTIAVGGFSFYLKRRTKRLKEAKQKRLDDQPPVYRSLFAPSDEEVKSFQKEEDDKRNAARLAIRRQNLIERANDDDFSVLRAANPNEDSALYNELFVALVSRDADEPEKTIRLAEYLSDNELTSSETLARYVLEIWKTNSTAIPVAKVLHVAALTDSAETYSQTLDEILSIRKKGEFKISGGELFALFESQYWLLSNETRISGAGFTLKEKLTILREEFSKS